MMSPADLLTPAATDIAAGWLVKLLPAEGNALSAALNQLSTILSLLAAGSVGWFTFAGIVSTAHDGKVLGDRWHTIWAPIRVLIGLGLLLPAFHGLGGGQLGVKELARYGSALASSVWSQFVTEIVDKGGMVPTPQTMTGGRVVRWAYESEVCHALASQTVLPGNPGYKPGTDPLPDAPPVGGNDTGGGKSWGYGSACGGLALPGGETADERTFAAARAAAVAAVISEIRASGTPAAVAKAAVMAVGQGGGDWPQGGVTAWLDQLAARYDREVTTAASAFVAARDRENRGKLAAAARAEGWVTAAKYWRTMADLSAVVAREAERLPDRRAVDLAAFDSTTHGAMISDGMRATYGAALAQLEAEAKSAAAPSVTADDLTQSGDSDSLFARLMAPLTRPIAAWALSVDDSKNPNLDPVGAMISLGHAAVGGAQAAIAGGVVVAAGTGNVVAGALGGEAAFSWVASFAKAAIYAVMIAGGVLAFGLPILPFVWVMWHAAAWIIAVVEAMIAVPIALLLWCRFDGAELVDGPQRAGISLLFALFLRPVIGILSLAATYFTIPMVVSTMRKEFGVTYLGNQGGHVIGVVGTVVGLGLLTYLTFKLTMFLLEQVAKSGDRIGRWFGAHPDHLDGSSGTTAVVAAIHSGGRSMGGGAGGPRPPSRDDDDGETGGASQGRRQTAGIKRGARE